MKINLTCVRPGLGNKGLFRVQYISRMGRVVNISCHAYSSNRVAVCPVHYAHERDEPFVTATNLPHVMAAVCEAARTLAPGESRDLSPIQLL